MSYRMLERVGGMSRLFLSSRTAVSVPHLMAKFEASRATIKRDLMFLRDRMRLPIQFDRDLGGYVLDR